LTRLSQWWSWLKLRRIDLLWLLVMAVLAALASTRPRHSPMEFVALGFMALVQIAEMRFGVFQRRRGAIVAVAVKLGLAWWLVWATEGIESSYYLIFLLPVVSAASTLGLAGTLLAALASSLAYCTFLGFVLWDHYELAPGGERELGIRVLFLFMTGILLNHFVTESRRVAEDLVKAQAAVRRAERLAALGQLSAGLAHELRNALGVIRGSAELIVKHTSMENEVAREMAALVAREVDRTNSLVTRFLDFARPSALHRSVQGLPEVIERAAKGFPVDTEYDPELPAFSFDAEMMERVFVNLISNGAQAMPNGGRLRVRARRTGESAEVEVTDAGVGIAPENRESIFNPFFTTKPDGVGLGLAIVSKIIDDHGGKIAVESEVGVGTTFRISLPLHRT
jgi:two-component system sensor histidine kinase HydH